MRDLAERSVVKQRLAQLQPQTKILGSSVRSVHTPASTAVQPPSSAIPEDLETDSIVDSYCYSPLPFTPFGQHSALSLGSPVTSASASPLPSPLTESPPGRPSTNDKLVRPVMDMLEAHALNQHNQMADLDAQLGGLKAEVQRLADEVTNALARPAGKSKYGGIAIPNAAAEKDEIPQDVEKTVRELEAKEDTQAMCIRRADGNDQCQGLQMLRVLAEENRHDQVILTERMNCLSEQVAGLDVTLRTALEGFSNKMEGVHIEIRRSPANWQEVPTKLDELAELQPRRMMDNSPPAASHSTSGMQEQVKPPIHSHSPIH